MPTAMTTTMTIRVSPEIKEKLDRISADTQRSRSFLAGEAVAAYVDRELAIIDGIQRGLKDVKAGLLVSHDEAMAELYRAIDTTKLSKGGAA